MSLIDTDTRLVQAARSLEDRPRLNTASIVDEALDKLREIPTIRIGHARMQDNRIELARMRSRLVYLKTQLLRERQVLARLRHDLENHLTSRYANFLRGASNDRSRRTMVDNALRPVDVRLRPIADALEIVETVLGDFDSRAFAFRDTTAALRLGDRDI